jgi:Uma2 family endonuclease
MSLAKNLKASTIKTAPTAIIDSEELWSDEPQLETPLHVAQMILLITCLQWWWRERRDYFVSGNISIYYEKSQGKQKPHKFRGPDFFVVLDTQAKERKSWVVWEESGRFPNLIVELLSDKTAKTDRTTKKELYQDVFKTPEYFWFHPSQLEFAGFRLIEGKYEPIPPNEQGWLWSEQLGLFLGVYESQLRFFTLEGELVLQPGEVAIREEQARECAQQQALEAQQQALEAQQRMAELEAILAQYRQRFGNLPD